MAHCAQGTKLFKAPLARPSSELHMPRHAAGTSNPLGTLLGFGRLHAEHRWAVTAPGEVLAVRSSQCHGAQPCCTLANADLGLPPACRHDLWPCPSFRMKYALLLEELAVNVCFRSSAESGWRRCHAWSGSRGAGPQSSLVSQMSLSRAMMP